MGRHTHTGRVMAAGVLIAVAATLTTTIALARHSYIVWVDGLVQRVEPKFREMRIWDYRAGTTT